MYDFNSNCKLDRKLNLRTKLQKEENTLCHVIAWHKISAVARAILVEAEAKIFVTCYLHLYGETILFPFLSNFVHHFKSNLGDVLTKWEPPILIFSYYIVEIKTSKGLKVKQHQGIGDSRLEVEYWKNCNNGPQPSNFFENPNLQFVPAKLPNLS